MWTFFTKDLVNNDELSCHIYMVTEVLMYDLPANIYVLYACVGLYLYGFELNFLCRSLPIQY